MTHSLLLLLLALLLQLGHGAQDATERQVDLPSLQRDPVLEAPLRELLQTPLAGASPDVPEDLDVRLQSAFVQCRELGITPLSYGNAGDSVGEEGSPSPADVAYCNRVRYVRHQRQHFGAVRKELALDQHVDQEDERQEVDRRVAEDVSFQEFFEQYAEQARPVVLELGGGSEENPLAQMLGLTGNADQSEGGEEDAVLQFLSVCLGATPDQSDGNDRVVTRVLRIEDAACATLLESTFRIPVYMTHDYVQRTNASRSEPFLPALLQLRSAVNVEEGVDAPADVESIVACPYGLHMLAIPMKGDAGVHVSLYSRRVEPYTLPAGTHDEMREIALAVDANVAINRERVTVLDSDFFERAPELYSSVKLEPGRSLLFAPGGVVTTMHSVPSSSSSSPAQMLRFCYCDAANVNDVKQAAAVDALLTTTAFENENGAAVALTLLQALQAPGFDASFSRRPTLSDTSWRSFVQWPREPSFLHKKNRRKRGEDGNTDDLDGDNEAEPLSRRERLKQWQDDKRWERHIASLTLPVPWPPVVVNTTRVTATLRWQELYQPLKHDLTSYGYELSWKFDEQETSGTNVVEGRREREGAVNVTHAQITRSAMPSSLFGDNFDGRDLEAVITGLNAETAYSFSVRLLVGEARGAVSGPSRLVVTSARTPPSPVRGIPEARDIQVTCLTLRWIDAEDDGGREIELYLVATEELPEKSERNGYNTGRGVEDATLVREHEKVIALNASRSHGQISAEPSDSGAPWKSTQVCGLFPGAAYAFRVAAMNALGAGHWSRRSARIEIPPRSYFFPPTDAGRRQKYVAPMLKGMGDPDYTVMSGVELLSQSDLTSLITSDPHRILRASTAQVGDATLPRVVLSDVEEQVVLLADDGDAKPQRTFEAWTGHYSPRLFDVSAELVLADPLDASRPLLNAHAVRDRVVLAVRGGAPFVFKLHHAQRAGALGLIIADVNGTCGGGFDQSCVPGADKTRNEGFAAQDRHALWHQTRIPCVLVLQDAALELLQRLGH
ncbi:hypothetical protein BBJ28_00013860 [Nothophytophthora sp. Chile5]|nr:hypothetical protein BBJ28_00013860 [Nothophytophthora sp. Chile5]